MKTLVGIVMGSDSDLPVMQSAADACADFGIGCERRVLSAHRTPDDTARYAKSAIARGLKVIIAGAGGAAHLAGVVAAHTTLPVIGVPVLGKSMSGLDSLLSMAQMPSGIPVATVAVNGGKNAGLLAVAILATSDKALAARLSAFRKKLAEESRGKDRALRTSSAPK
jgi:5-(carboxyamino)imidazole ribonucleotide mutase